MADSIFDRFKDISKVDIEKYFNDFVDFSDNNYRNIVGYYTRGEELLSETINALDSLVLEAQTVKSGFENYRDQLSLSVDFWELLNNFEETFQKIETIQKSQKWFRSSKGLNFSNDTEKDYVLRQGQTLTGLADELGYENPNDDFVDLALSNELREEDYNNEGGVKLKVAFQNNAEYKINSVIDSTQGEKIYGLDLDKKIQYVDDDVKILSYTETILQSYKILLELVKGANPEFPGDGINKGILGGNLNSLQYPVIFRQLTNSFGNDDSFVEFSINEISREQDQVFIETSAKTRIGEVLRQNLKIS